MQDAACAQPCQACPFRRQSLPGWLGNSSSEEFMQQTLADLAMPCHKTIDYEDADWSIKWADKETGKLCAGALIFFANICKRSRDPARPAVAADRSLVFSSAAEFVAHHDGAIVKSWEFEEP